MAVELLYDGVDIIDDVVISDAAFSSQVNGIPGQCRVRVKDTPNTAAFVAGKELLLKVDGDNVWRGYVAMIRRTFAFPAEDRSTEKPRFFVLDGFDINILFRKRVVFDQSNPIDLIGPRYATDNTPDTTALTDLFTDFLDLSGDGLDTSTLIENVGYVNIDHPASPIQPSGTWEGTMKNITSLTNAIFYIDPDLNVVHTDVDTPSAALDLSDQPGVGAVGYREMEIVHDGTNLINDALIWGIALGGNNVVISREEDAVSIADHGRWQFGELNGGMYKQLTVDRRADSIVDGSPLSKRGAKNDRVSVVCTVFADGFRPTQKVDFTSNVFGFTDVIPIRRMDITFVNPQALRYRLFLSHEIDMPWGFFDNYFYKFPGIGLPPLPDIDIPGIPEPGGDGECDCLVDAGTYDDFNRTLVSSWGTPSIGIGSWSMVGTPAESVDGTRGVIVFSPTATDMQATLAHYTGSPWHTSFVMTMTFEYDTAVPALGNYEFIELRILVIGTTANNTQGLGLYIGGEADDPSYIYVNNALASPFSDLFELPDDPPPNEPIFLKLEYIQGGAVRAKVWWDPDPEPDWMASFTAYGIIGDPRRFELNIEGTYDVETYYEDLVFSGADRCMEVQFDDFDRSVVSGWGTATPSGYVWTVTGTNASKIAEVTNGMGRFRTTDTTSPNTFSARVDEGPWKNNTGFTMHSRVKMPARRTFGAHTVSFQHESVNRELQLTIYDAGNVGLSEVNLDGTATALNFTPNARYNVKWEYEWPGTVNRVKVWSIGVAEPGTWTVDAAGSGDADPTVDPNSQFLVEWGGFGSSVATSVEVDFLEFDYVDKPCYYDDGDPVDPPPTGGAPDSGNYCQFIEHTVGGNDFATTKAFVSGTLKIWVNGVLITSFTSDPALGQFHLTTAIDPGDVLWVCYWANGDPS